MGESPTKKLRTVGWEISTSSKAVYAARVSKLREMVLNDTDAEVIYWQVASLIDDWHWEDLRTASTVSEVKTSTSAMLRMAAEKLAASASCSSSSGSVPQNLSPPPGETSVTVNAASTSTSLSPRKPLTPEQLALVERNRQAAFEARAKRLEDQAEFERIQTIMEGQQWMY